MGGGGGGGRDSQVKFLFNQGVWGHASQIICNIYILEMQFITFWVLNKVVSMTIFIVIKQLLFSVGKAVND